MPTELLSADVGIVHRIDDGVTGWDHPRLASAFARICDLRPLTGERCGALPAGMGVDVQQARLAAYGEAVERYSASLVPSSRLRRRSVGDVVGAVVGDVVGDVVGAPDCVPPAWLGAADEQALVSWCAGARLLPGGSSRPALLAASRVYLSDLDADTGIAITTSTGLACHDQPWHALRSALLEVIERDAVMTTWLTRRTPTPITGTLSWSTHEGTRIHFDRAVERYGLYLLPSPTAIPVVLGVAYGAAGQPPVAVGAAASLHLAVACRKALIEAHQTFRWATHMQAERRAVPASPAALIDLDDHVAYYLDPGRVTAFEFLDRPARAAVPVDLDVEEPGADAAHEVTAILGRCAAAGLPAYVADVTAPDVREAGLWVLRAVLPELYPLVVGMQLLDAHPRLPRESAVNPDPHPFP